MTPINSGTGPSHANPDKSIDQNALPPLPEQLPSKCEHVPPDLETAFLSLPEGKPSIHILAQLIGKAITKAAGNISL